MNENLSMLWAGALLDELARCGVKHVVASPGSRSAPLTLSAARDKRITLHMVLDERSAGFFALGMAKTSHVPVAVVCTSGTAAANLHPAVVEAYQSRIPLLVVTADRPPELRDVGANQSIEQAALFGASVVWEADLGIPEPRPASLRHLRQVACRAVARAAEGPVHLNVPLREPLEPSPQAGLPEFVKQHPLEAAGRPAGAPWTHVDAQAVPALPDAELAALAATLAEPRGILVAGPGPQDAAVSAAANALASRLGIPLLADALSNCRGGRDALVHADAFLASSKFLAAAKPAWILQWGAAVTSKNVRAFLQAHPAVPRVVLTEDPRLWDETEAAHRVMRANVASTLTALVTNVPKPQSDGWTNLWRDADAAAARVHASDKAQAWEGAIGRIVAGTVGPDDVLWLGSSLPVRDVERFGGRITARTMANRGASGIDGVLSSACGAAIAHTTGRVVLYIGELSFLHDAGALALAAKCRNLLIVVVNNGGGRIFEQLAVVDHVERALFERVMATPQNVDIGALCAAFKVHYTKITGGAKLAETMANQKSGVIEVVVDGPTTADYRKSMLRRAAEAVDQLA